ncbi:MAG TPA: recombinase RecT [Sphingomonas sp.]|jgi:recombination protein RecT
MATQIQTNPVAVIRQNLTAMAPQFAAALPAHITVEKFTRVAMTAIQNNPDLANADRNSLFGSIVRLAQDGLLPDGREAAIVLFSGKAQAMPMIAGILKKIRQSGDVAKVSAYVVYEADEFVVSFGFDEEVRHVPPPLDKPRGKAIGAYATAVLKDGSRLLEVMSLEEIEKVRSVSRAKGNGPWVQWWGEMARKTVMRRLSKRLPMSTDLEEAFDRDETVPEVVTAVEHDAAPLSRLDALEQQITHQPEGRDDDGYGDQFDGTAADLATLFDNAKTPDDLTAARKAYAVAGTSLSDPERAMVDARAREAEGRV